MTQVTQTAPMNAGQIRVIDPILSNIALGYSDMDFIGDAVVPRVPVNAMGGQILQFGKESFMASHRRRSPGGRMHRMDIGFLGKHYSLVQDGIEGKVPFEWLRDAQNVPGIDLGTRALNAVMRVITLGLEIDRASLVTNPANFSAGSTVTLTGTSKWSDGINSSPVTDVDLGRETIRSLTGTYPNTLTLGPRVFNALKNHSKIKDQFKYSSADSLTTDMLARYFTIDRVLVGRAVQSDDSGTMTDVWGNYALLSYSPLTPSGIEQPAFAYTYTMEGHPLVEQPYFERDIRSWLYPTVMERQPVITCADAGYLIQGPV